LESTHPRKRYLFERVGIFALLFSALLIASAIIVMIPYDDIYLTDSGAPKDYLTAFVAIAVISTCVLIIGLFYNAMVWMEGNL